MLNEFSAVKVDSSKKPAEAPPQAEPKPESKSATPAPEAPPGLEDAFSEEEFAKQLQAGMADLLGELEKSVG
jgi:peroxin-19